MKEQLIRFETAKLAKKKKFNEICNNSYINMGFGLLEEGLILGNKYKRDYTFCTAPSQSLLQKWLREKHKIHIDISFDDNEWYVSVGEFTIPDFVPESVITLSEKESFKESINAYEEALELGLESALKLIK